LRHGGACFGVSVVQKALQFGLLIIGDAHELARALPTTGAGLSWDHYLFIPSQKSVMVDGAEINLRPAEFELDLEFFHNVDRVLSRDWLRAMTSGMVPDASSRWIDANVARLRSHLGLASLHGGEWRLNNVRYAGYKLSREHGKKHPKVVAAAQRHLRHQPESSP
jgi:DNA-binding response OmpR family regulator